LVPGKSGLPIVNGNAYGCGIYLSSCPKMSLSYVRDHPKLLVCALLEGDRNKVTNHGVIRVAKDPAYVLPCYILHYKGTPPRPSSGYQRLMSNPLFHTFLFCLFSFVKLLVLLIGLSIICFIGSLSCLGYYYFMDRPPNEICYEVNTVIWNSYVYFFYSIICYTIYYIILWPLFYLLMGLIWVASSLHSLVSWMLFWTIYYAIVLLINNPLIGLGISITAPLILLLIEHRNKKRGHLPNTTYLPRKKRYY